MRVGGMRAKLTIILHRSWRFLRVSIFLHKPWASCIHRSAENVRAIYFSSVKLHVTSDQATEGGSVSTAERIRVETMDNDNDDVHTNNIRKWASKCNFWFPPTLPLTSYEVRVDNLLIPSNGMCKGCLRNKVTRPLTCVMFIISFKFPARSEQVEHCFLSRTLDRASYQSYCANTSCRLAGLAETWSNIEVRSVIRFMRLKGTSLAEIHRQLVEVYGANVMSQKHVWVWCTAFDNGQPHAWVVRRNNWEVLDHPPYSPDLAPSDFHLFGPLKKHLGGRQSATDGEVQQAVMSWLQVVDPEFFSAGIDAVVYP
jgi:hypothetical protein